MGLWDLTSYAPLEVPQFSTTPRAAVTALAWVTGVDDPWETLCYGTATGWLVFWQENIRQVCNSPIYNGLICLIFAENVRGASRS